MNSFNISRFLAIALLILVRSVINPLHFLVLVSIIALSHYFVAFFYSWNSLKKTYVFNPVLTILCIAIALAIGHYSFISIAIYFGIHHVLSEYYMNKDTNALSIPRTLILALTYVFYIKRLVFMNTPILYLVFIIAFASYWLCILYFTYKKKISKDFFITEILGLILFITFYFNKKYGFVEIVGYHFFVWLFLPYIQFPNINLKRRYVIETAMTFGLFIVAAVFFHHYIRPDIYTLAMRGLNLMSYWGFFHITLSFIVSKQNPSFILRQTGR
jgi:hypothetical protein